MQLHITHPWHVSPEEAQRIQRDLAARVRVEPLPHHPQTIGGIDVSFPQPEVARAAVVIVRFPDLTPIAQVTMERRADFPYIPGLLSFRETPAVLDALEQLAVWPDLLMCDAQGQAHPRRLGLASHLGVLLNHPTVGCAKSKLIGRYDEPGNRRGAYAWLYDGDEVIGAVVRTREGAQPLFVSVGHRIDLPGAIELTLACCPRYRLPEPTRLAHQAAAGESVVPPGTQPSLF